MLLIPGIEFVQPVPDTYARLEAGLTGSYWWRRNRADPYGTGSRIDDTFLKE